MNEALAPLPNSISPHLPKYAKDADREYVGDPWERQEKETRASYEAFRKFIDMGEGRTVANLNRQMGRDPQHRSFYAWSKKHRWVERADAWDAFQDQIRLNRLKRRQIKAAEKHADDVAELQQIVTRPMGKLRERLAAMAEDGNDWLDALTDEQLEHMVVQLGSHLPGLQKAERDALTSVADVPVRDNQAKVKGAILKRILGDNTMRGMVEQTLFIVEESEPQE